MTMQAKDYGVVTMALQSALDSARTAQNIHDEAIVYNVSAGIAAGFSALNPRFDRQRFFKEIGFDEAPIGNVKVVSKTTTKPTICTCGKGDESIVHMLSCAIWKNTLKK